MSSSKSAIRENWGKSDLPLPKLDLLAVQKKSYKWFINEGVKKAIREISPINDPSHKVWELKFGRHYFESPKVSPEEAKTRGLNYEASLKVVATLKNLKTDQVSKQEVFLGDIPQMTDIGTFIISGVERCVVSQLVRSPGVFFSASIDPSSGRKLYQAELRPIRGSWLEFQVNRNDVIYAKIDRSHKLPITTLLRILGLSTDADIQARLADVNTDKEHDFVMATLAKDQATNTEEALVQFHEKMRPGEPVVLENARQLFQQYFFDSRRYDLGPVGRYKLNKRLGLNIPVDTTDHVLTADDFLATIKELIKIQVNSGQPDDIDHLSNRRVRCVGELVYQIAFRVGMLRLERAIREKMALAKPSDLRTPSNLVNARPIIAIISEFFKRNRLSTILDQTNPLSEIDNIRRLSVMGPGGVTRERASFSMRDINASQYSRICPVRSPEGPNIGLVTYLALYAKINDFGFLEAPYRKLKLIKKNGKTKVKLTNEVVYLQADDEQNYKVTHAEINLDRHGYITDEWLPYRHKGEFLEGPAEEIDFIDVVSRQVVGTSASLIPFVAHDEANRALMGTHMQCQAVPLLEPKSPVVGTGMEQPIVSQIQRVIYSQHRGQVNFVDANQVVIKDNQNKEHSYPINKFVRSAQSTCYSQQPVVQAGQKVKPGDLIIDGPASENGELALGRNLLIAYASFDGLGYEDAIIVSDRLVKQDVLTSIHINEYESQLMDTKLGPEELTRDIPNVSETDLANLGEDGIVVVGSEVNQGDILVGKIAPKGETELTAEERLLRAIFGEKAREVRDTSLRMPHGERGTIIDVQILDRKDGEELEPGVLKKIIVKVAQVRKVTVGDKLAGRHGNKGVISKVVPQADMPYLADGTPIDIIISPLSVLARMNLGQLLEAHLGWAVKKLNKKVALPVFEKVSEEKITQELKKAGFPVSGKAKLFDGRTGLSLTEETSVGVSYILKLSHMVEDKTHARSTGPYSLVTQQPLGGKAQMGGQRLGEMEVWALEAHQAAHSLQEMLTIKSDDVIGRSRAFEAIIKSLPIPEAAVPESFKVLVKELNALSLNVVPQGGKVENIFLDEQIDDELQTTDDSQSKSDNSKKNNENI